MLKMRSIFLAAALTVGVSGLASAQQAAPQDPAAVLVEDWNAYLNAQRHVVGSIQTVTTELMKTRKDLAAVTSERDNLKAELAKLKPDGEKKP